MILPFSVDRDKSDRAHQAKVAEAALDVSTIFDNTDLLSEHLQVLQCQRRWSVQVFDLVDR